MSSFVPSLQGRYCNLFAFDSERRLHLSRVPTFVLEAPPFTMSAFFPHVNRAALKKFAAAAAAAEHPHKGNARTSKKANPRITSCEDVIWGGEKVRTCRALYATR